MTAYYYGGFDLAQYGSLDMTLNGATPVSITAATNGSTKLSHVSISGVMGGVNYGDLATRLNTVFNGAIGGTFTCSFANGVYTLTRNTNWTVTFPNTAGGNRAADLLGFARNSTTATTTTFSSTRRPLRVVIPVYAALFDDTNTKEESGKIAEAVASNGVNQYSVSPIALAKIRDWNQSFEPPTVSNTAGQQLTPGASARVEGATVLIPESWESFFQAVRAQHPILYVPSNAAPTVGRVFRLRAEGAHFDPTRHTANYDGYWDIVFKTRRVGEQ